ncbi:HYR domain-containing protein [Flavobacterium yafengii]|uniref:HYR domain-containing protein n=1 Tax=Flavobacterium yafengii TaxID=3041253 RepID=A0AAW6TL09_9FLAO|nr:HYR domain-containing protein [Flavobacterium yafengii]MDI5949126.1 HYR domain-containing protein [Flavobacterium yafengii]
MKQFYQIRHFLAFLSIFCCFSGSLLAQGTSPVPQNIPYVQDFSTLPSSSTTYPPGFQGWTASVAPGSSYNTNANLGADRALTANSAASTTSGNFHNYNGKIGFLNSGSLDLTIGLAINTVGKSAIEVQFDAMVIRNPYDGSANTRINEMVLQYRIGTTTVFNTLPTTSYLSNTVRQTTSGVTAPLNPVTIKVILPAECNNQEVVQLRWISKQNSGSGSRPSFAIDNIKIQNDITPPVNVAGFPKIDTILSDGFDFSSQINETGTTYFVVLAAGSSKPSPAQIIAGLDSNGNTALQADLLLVTDETIVYTKNITGLTLGTSYEVYSISKDTFGNIQTEGNQISVKTSSVLTPKLLPSINNLNFGYSEQNFDSKTLNYQLQYANLTDVVTLTAQGNFSISKNQNDNFQSTLTFDATDLAANNNMTVYVRFTPNALGASSGSIVHQSAGAANKTVILSGTGINPYIQNFNDVNVLTNSGWTAYSVSGDKVKWASTSTRFNSSPAAVLMNGYSETGASKDWLISPSLRLDSFDKFPLLSFYARKFYAGSNLKLMISTDYDGISNPETATWTALEGDFPSTTGAFKQSKYINLEAYKTNHTYVAWVYETPTNAGDNSAEWTIDDVSITNEATFLASNPNLNFGEVSPNSTSDSQSFIFMAGGYGDFTIAAPLDYLLSVDNVNFGSNVVVSQTEALAGKTIYARFAPTSKALSLSGSLTITATELNQEIGLFTGSSLPKTETFDIVTYNLEFFGSNVIGSTGSEFGPIDDALQIENVAKVMNKLNADVYVIQEVSDEPSLDLLIQKISINGKTFDKSVSPAWSYSFAPADPLFPDQKLVVLYNTQTTKVNKARVMFSDLYDNIRAGNTTLPNYPGSSSSFFASGRLPYLVNVETNINGVKKEINLIDLHGRANSGSDISRYNMRKYDAEFLKDSLDAEYPNANFMILGDYNDDVDVSVISPNPSSYQKMVADTDRYNALTLEISKAGAYSYLGSGGFLDHIIVSNELTNEYVPNSVAVYDPRLDIANYVNTTSDHGPVIARFELKKQEQTIAFPSIIVSETVTSYDLTATATSGLNVTYISSDETIARINNNTIQIVGAGTVTITATQSGNEYYSAAVDATQSLTITDTILPAIPTLANITQNNDNGFCGAIVNFVAPSGTDNFSGASTIQTAGLPSGAEYPIGTTTNTFQVTDASGNSAISSFNVTVTDTELPTLISSGNIIQKKEGKLHGVAVTYTLPVGNDNCTGFTITQTEGLSSGSIFPLGVTTNTFKIVDASGNTANCSFTVTVVQAITPKNSDANPVLSVVAHPNPATDFVNITVKTDAPKNMTLRLYDIFGMLIGSPIEISGITTENTIQINVSNFRRGVYVFTLSTENKILFTDKIIKK